MKPTVSGGLQCRSELVKNSTDADNMSQCESNTVSNAGIGAVLHVV